MAVLRRLVAKTRASLPELRSTRNGCQIAELHADRIAQQGWQQDVLSSATRFFWKNTGVPYLVTNWHVVSGRDPFTGGVTSESQYIPAQFNFLRA